MFVGKGGEDYRRGCCESYGNGKDQRGRFMMGFEGWYMTDEYYEVQHEVERISMR